MAENERLAGELVVTSRISIPRSEFELAFARSSGPGGQNVNKVNSKVQLRWAVAQSPSLPPDVRERFLARFASRLVGEGRELLVVSQRHRDQAKNVEDCLDKLREMVAAVATPPKIRRPTKPTKGSKQRRLAAKKQHSERKAGRQFRGE
jgi:ribosome-associated protein